MQAAARPAGSPPSAARALPAPRAVTRLDTLECPYPPPAPLLGVLHAELERVCATLHRTPPSTEPLRQALAEHLRAEGHGRLSAAHLWLANGADELLALTLSVLGGPGRTLLGFEPSRAPHRRVAAATCTWWLAGQRGRDLELDVDRALDAVLAHTPGAVVLASPNNPDGRRADPKVINALLQAGPAVVIVDETHAAYDEPNAPSALDLLPDQPRLLVLRTLTGPYALTGARVGYLAADPSLVRTLARRTPPHHLSTLTQAAVRAALACAGEVRLLAAAVRADRAQLAAGLTGLGLDVLPSAAHYLLFGRLRAAHQVQRDLAEHGVLVREVGVPGRLRARVGPTHANQRLLDALAQINPETQPDAPRAADPESEA